MRAQLLLAILLISQLASAQSFVEKSPPTALEKIKQGSVAFSDIDNDGDPDALITGWDSAYQNISKLFTNDSTGSFTEVSGTPFTGVINSSIAFSDVDGDGDSDVLITGLDSNLFDISKLYKNDGAGIYTEVRGVNLERVQRSSIAFSDIDGDGDNDLLIAGENISGESIANLYKNNGSGVFTVVSGTSFKGVRFGSVAFNDVDGDGDADLLITGSHITFSFIGPIAALYKNDGNGNFTEVSGTSFDGVTDSSIAFSDIDGDGDSDVLITGEDESRKSSATLYRNSGNGSFRKISNTPFEGVRTGSVAFADVDSDGDSDVLITGRNNVISPSSAAVVAKLYTNDGSGTFTEVMGTPFEGVEFSSIAFSDVDGDGDPDVLITGQDKLRTSSARLYINETWPTSLSKPLSKLAVNLNLYPNPGIGDRVNLQFEAKKEDQIQIRILDLKGRIVRSQDKQVRVGENSFQLDISQLNAGVHIIQILDSEGGSIQKRLLR